MGGIICPPLPVISLILNILGFRDLEFLDFGVVIFRISGDFPDPALGTYLPCIGTSFASTFTPFPMIPDFFG